VAELPDGPVITLRVLQKKPEVQEACSTACMDAPKHA
jgi:hypothetical protein